MLVGNGGNIAVQIGDQGPMVVNTGAGQLADKTIAGGNVKLRASGYDPSLVGSFFSGQFADAGQGATIIGHQNTQTRLIALKTPSEGWPSDTFVEARRTFPMEIALSTSGAPT
jgi:hypothetical protein